ncbi:MAG: hypothetical protein EP146_02990 [Oscillibacter sp.]|uniref:hypothetical protein n=1 Tax=Oscillibacter sp. TaxID=1945593 RepID=UPI001324B7E1|nr:hypothetical protein [Oscillibacter sp.]MUU10410.1 hypothetical protein [Oscillibacter sp.]
MSEQMYERKKDFVNHALSRCVAAMYPNVCRVAYHTRDTDEGLRETAMIYLAGGYSRRVDVTGMDLPPRWTPYWRFSGRRRGMGRYTGRERRQRALYRLAIVVWIIVLALVLCMDTAG